MERLWCAEKPVIDRLSLFNASAGIERRRVYFDHNLVIEIGRTRPRKEAPVPLDGINVLAHAATSGANPNVVILVVAFFALVLSKKATRNTIRILHALSRMVDAGLRRKK